MVSRSLARVVVAMTVTLVGCQPAQEQDAATTATPATTASPAPAATTDATPIAAWRCPTLEACLDLRVGRERVFNRRVGQSSERETWRITDRQTTDRTVAFAQRGGPARYELRDDALAMTLRGELIEALRAPVQAGDRFTATSARGVEALMTVLSDDVSITTPAGAFTGCVRHEARFVNAEQPGDEGLRVETVLCEGIGEVWQRMEAPVTPLPIVFELAESIP